MRPREGKVATSTPSDMGPSEYDEYKPVVVVSADQLSSQNSLADVISSFLAANDDVFSLQFLTDTIIVQGESSDLDRLREQWTQWTTPAPHPITGSWALSHGPDEAILN